MKKSKKTICLLSSLILLTVLIAAVHLATRTSVPEKTLLVEFQGEVKSVNVAALPLKSVQGSLVNGKGETREVSGTGCLLSEVLAEAAIDLDHAVNVKVIASDEFSATVSAEEWSLPDGAYLLLEETGLQLVVFGDSNSKRNVKNVERLQVG